MSVIKECAGQLEPGIEQFILSPMSRENSSSEIDYREFLYDIYRCTPPTLFKVLQRVIEEVITDTFLLSPSIFLSLKVDNINRYTPIF